MEISSSSIKFNFPLQDLSKRDINALSEDHLINVIVREFHPNRRRIASGQLKFYFNQISSHPHMKSVYIEKMKQLIQVEKIRGVNCE
ncbi:MAG: hypothetical protein ACFFG0_09020 [Candidatus Thorarchaeota archaeon]